MEASGHWRLTMGADPIVVAVSVVSGELDGFLVRKAEKQHGTGQRIEGFRQKGAPVVIVDDVCTTGSSTIQAIEAAREFGFEIVGVMCLVEREEAKGRPGVEKAASPHPSSLSSRPTTCGSNICFRTTTRNNFRSVRPHANSAASPPLPITLQNPLVDFKFGFAQTPL